MIKATKIYNFDKKDILAIGIEINDKSYFASIGQEDWPNLRVGDYPRKYDSSIAQMVSFPRDVIMQDEQSGKNLSIEQIDKWGCDLSSAIASGIVKVDRLGEDIIARLKKLQQAEIKIEGRII